MEYSVENYAVFKIEQPDDSTLKDYNRCLLTDIAQQVQKRGIKCSKVKQGSFCVFIICELYDKEISVVLYEFELFDKSSLQSSIECINRIPLLKRLFITYSRNEGKQLQKICAVLRDIINNDSRFVDVKWMTCEEWRKKFLGHNITEV